MESNTKDHSVTSDSRLINHKQRRTSEGTSPGETPHRGRHGNWRATQVSEIIKSQSGSLGHNLLKRCLNAEGYFQSQVVLGLSCHKSRNIQFVLVVDDFGIEFVQQSDLDHLINTLQKYYDVSIDMTGQEYVKINLDWDYHNQKFNLSMEPYLQKALTNIGINPPRKKVHSP